MNQAEKAALHERFSNMDTDEKLFEIAVMVYDPDRPPCSSFRVLAGEIRGNGKRGLVQQVRWLCISVCVLTVAIAGPKVGIPLVKWILTLI